MNRYTWRTGILEIVLIAAAAVYAIPLYVLVNLSVRPKDDTSPAMALTTSPTFDHYIEAWNRADLGSAMISSITITVGSILILIFTSSLAAYALVRSTSRLSTVAFWVILVGLLLPFQIALIPLYFTMRDIGLLGSVWGLIIFYGGQLIPFSVFLYSGFLRSMPRDYEEAAWIDGASTFGAFWRVVFPLLRPITGTVIILNAISVWNDLLTPLMYLSGSGSETIPVALRGFVDQFNSDWPLIFAGLIIGISPILIVFFILQKTVIKGFASGIKG